MTTADTPTGQQAAAAPADAADGLLFHLANTLGDISDRIPSGLWYRIHLLDLPAADMAPVSPDIEIVCPGTENARLLSDALPWAGPVHHFVQPGSAHDHYTWQGRLGDFEVRVVGLEPAGGAS